MTTTDHPDRARLSRISGEGVIDTLAGAGWDDLPAGNGPADPLRRTAWLRAWRGGPGAGVEPRCVIVDRARSVVAAGPLEVVTRRGLRIVRHLGQGDAWFHIEPPAVDDRARELMLSAIAVEPGDILLLDGFSADPDTTDALRSSIRGAQLTPTETWRLSVAEPPRSMRKRRKEAGRAQRRAAERGVAVNVSVTSSWGEIDSRLHALLDFHRDHFAGDGPNLLAGPGTRRRFAQAGISALGAEGRARLVEVTLKDGPVVAWDLAFVGDGHNAVAYAGAFDRSREDIGALGWISMSRAIEALDEEGVEMIDFGPGPAPYKDLISTSVPLVRVTAPLSARGRVALAGRRAATSPAAIRARRALRRA